MKDSGNFQLFSYFQSMEVSLRELLVDKRIVTPDRMIDVAVPKPS